MESPTQVSREEFEAWVVKNRKRLEKQMTKELIISEKRSDAMVRRHANKGNTSVREAD